MKRRGEWRMSAPKEKERKEGVEEERRWVRVVLPEPGGPTSTIRLFLELLPLRRGVGLSDVALEIISSTALRRVDPIRGNFRNNFSKRVILISGREEEEEEEEKKRGRERSLRKVTSQSRPLAKSYSDKMRSSASISVRHSISTCSLFTPTVDDLLSTSTPLTKKALSSCAAIRSSKGRNRSRERSSKASLNFCRIKSNLANSESTAFTRK